MHVNMYECMLLCLVITTTTTTHTTTPYFIHTHNINHLHTNQYPNLCRMDVLSYVYAMIAIGCPPPAALDMQTMSGTIPDWLKAKKSPERQNPDCTSSTTRGMSLSAVMRRISRKAQGDISFTPPSPWEPNGKRRKEIIGEEKRL